VTTSVNAVLFFRVVDPSAAVVEVQNYIEATRQIAMTTLRSVLGGVELDQLLSERESINLKLQEIIDEQTDPWGIKVKSVEIKDVKIPVDMQRAIARQAEAERERRAKIINAEGELQAATKLSEAAGIIAKNPAALQLRYLQSLVDISAENASTIVFPIPIDMFKSFQNKDSEKGS
jgi:regulator of protease activity HflC (stomatin/prohibitin superfamily)